MPMVFMSELPVVSESVGCRTPYALAMRLLWLASLIKRHQKVLISVQIVLGGAIRDEGIAVESDECTISIKESFYIGR